MAAGIRFYNVIWDKGNGFANTIEASHSMRYLKDQIKKNYIEYFNNDCTRWTMVKVQEIETPMVEIEWLLDLFTTSGNKKTREVHKEQAAYVLRLVESCAARVVLEDGSFIER